MGLTPEEEVFEEFWLDRMFTAGRELKDTVPDLESLAAIGKMKSVPTAGWFARHTVPVREGQAG